MQIRAHASLFVVTVGILATASGHGVLAQAKNPFVGTWKLNVAKSTFSPGPAPQSATTSIEEVSRGMQYVVDQVSATGEKQHWEFTADYDGQDNRVIGMSPYGDGVALTRNNLTTVTQVNKFKGRVTTTQTAVVSADGKIRTITQKGLNLQGEAVNDVIVFEKQ